MGRRKRVRTHRRAEGKGSAGQHSCAGAGVPNVAERAWAVKDGIERVKGITWGVKYGAKKPLNLVCWGGSCRAGPRARRFKAALPVSVPSGVPAPGRPGTTHAMLASNRRCTLTVPCHLSLCF